MEARKSVLIMANQVVGALMGLAALLAIGRFVAPRSYGMVGFSLAVVNIAAVFARLGFDRAHVKRVSEGVPLDVAVGTYAPIRLGLTILTTGLLVLAAWAWDLRGGFADATTLAVVLVMTVYFLGIQVRAIFGSTFQALRRSAQSQSLELAENVVRSLLLVAAALIVGAAAGRNVPLFAFFRDLAVRMGYAGGVPPRDAAVLLAGAYAVAAVLSLGWGVWVFVRHRYAWGRFDRALARRYVRFALPMFLLGVVAVLSNQVDQFMLGYFWGARDVGHYFAAQRVIQILMMVPLAVATLLFPLVSEMAGRGDREGTARVGREAGRLQSLFMAPLAAFLVAFPVAVLHVFVGDNFLPGAPVLALLAAQTWLFALTMVPAMVIQGMDRPRVAMTVGVVLSGSNVLLNLVLIPDTIFGLPVAGMRGTGAALATLISQGLGLAVAMWAVRPLLRAWVLPRHVVFHAAIAAVVVGLLWLAWSYDIIVLDRIWQVAGFGLLAAIAYAALSWAAGTLTRVDVALARDVLHPGRMRTYVRDELQRKR